MTGLCGCLIRRIAGLFGVVVAVALIAAPVALANGDTITAQAKVQFSGVVDSRTSPAPRRPRSIDWGDGHRDLAGPTTRSSNVVSGTHTYATRARYTGTITLTGRQTAPADAGHRSRLTSRDASEFTQCPAVYLDTGCQFLITVNNGTETVTQDANQGPYEGADDALIGVQNNSSSPVSALPLSVPNSDLFGFDERRHLRPRRTAGSVRLRPAGGRAGGRPSARLSSTNCSFPAPSESPPATPSRVHQAPGSPQNGYEGPTSWFSNVSTDTSSGVVHFSPAIPPGGIDLLQPRGAAGRHEHRRRRHGAPVQRDVAADGLQHRCELLGPRQPERSGDDRVLPVRARPQIQQVRRLGTQLHQLDRRAIAPRRLQRPFRDRVRVRVKLVPNALYHVRLVATNGSGTTFGPDMTFTTSHGADARLADARQDVQRLARSADSSWSRSTASSSR